MPSQTFERVQVNVRLPAPLRDRLARQAERYDLSMNAYVERILAEAVEAPSAPAPAPDPTSAPERGLPPKMPRRPDMPELVPQS